MPDLKARYDTYVRTFNEALPAIFGVVPHDNTVMRAAWYSLSNGGKRLRAVLCMAACEMAGGTAVAALPFAAALEMVHAYSLIHDDLPCMDDDDMRRGKPACHIQFGEATALLAGDALLTKAFGTIAGADLTPSRRVTASGTLAWAAGAENGIIRGQMLDMAFENNAAVTTDQLIKMNAFKTGALIIAAVKLGFYAGDSKDNDLFQALAVFANDLGLLFQITDDILDETAVEEELGKPIGSDKVRGKTTWVSLLGLEEARSLAQGFAASAKRALAPFGGKADFFLWLADYVLNRTK